MKFSDISVQIIKNTFNTRFFLAKLCRYFPPLSIVVDKLFFEGDDIIVLPRDKTVHNTTINEIKINQTIKREDTILPSQVLKEMIIKSKYHFIMDHCICRVSNHCENYPPDFGCLFLGKGTKHISTKLGKSVTVQEALEHVNKCQKAGLVHIIGRNKIDSVWLNTGPKEDLLSICNCCQCCCLWKMATELPDKLGNNLTPMLGVELKFDESKCISCGNCAKNICFLDAIKINSTYKEIDFEKCRCCGRCVETCPEKALTIKIESDSVNNSIEHVKPLVDIESE